MAQISGRVVNVQRTKSCSRRPFYRTARKRRLCLDIKCDDAKSKSIRPNLDRKAAAVKINKSRLGRVGCGSLQENERCLHGCFDGYARPQWCEVGESHNGITTVQRRLLATVKNFEIDMLHWLKGLQVCYRLEEVMGVENHRRGESMSSRQSWPCVSPSR